MRKNKLSKVLSLLAVMALSLGAATSSADAFVPAVKSGDGDLVMSMPQKIVNKKPFQFTVEAAKKGVLTPAITDIIYKWNIDVCDTKQTVTKKLSTNPAAYRHLVKSTFTNGCTVKITLETTTMYAPVGNEPGDGTVTVDQVNSKLTLTDDIKLSGPSKVKVGQKGAYTAEYELSANQQPTWFAGYSCNVLKIGYNTEYYPYMGTTFHWEPKRIVTCNAEALAVYRTVTSGNLTEIEYAVKKMPISSY